MANVTVRRNAFEFGEFPPVCCKTGERASLYSRWEFKGGRYAGVLPFATAAMRRVRVARRAVWGFGLVAVAAVAIGAFDGPRALIPGVMFAAMALLFLLCAWHWSPSAKLGEADVELKRVHPRFVESVSAPAASP
jgi:hypothetical protein